VIIDNFLTLLLVQQWDNPVGFRPYIRKNRQGVNKQRKYMLEGKMKGRRDGRK